MTLKIMTDENIPNAVTTQLVKNGVEAIRLIDGLPEGTPDPDVLEYCHQHGYIFLTMDTSITKHIDDRVNEGKEHAGVFIGVRALQISGGIGVIVSEIVFFNDAIENDAATLEADVYNQVRYNK